MPTYQYRCQQCDELTEAVQKFTDDPLTECPRCGGSLRKVFSPVGIVFKGSGFYATDSKGKSRQSAATPGHTAEDGKPEPAPTKETTPAAAKETTPAAAKESTAPASSKPSSTGGSATA